MDHTKYETGDCVMCRKENVQCIPFFFIDDWIEFSVLLCMDCVEKARQRIFEAKESYNCPVCDQDLCTICSKRHASDDHVLIEEVVYHGKVIACSGYCGLKCTEPLFICTSCYHVECDVCIEDYSDNIDKLLVHGGNKCRRCGALDRWKEFSRSNEKGIHKIPEAEFNKNPIPLVIKYGDLPFNLLERIIWELKRLYLKVRHYNP